MKSTNTIYKLVGPALVEQDQTEAKANVEKRLEFIKSEMCVITIAPVLTVTASELRARSRSRRRRRTRRRTR